MTVVLVVDDSPYVREGLTEILDAEFEVRTAEDGFDALGKAAYLPKGSVVLSDTRMPKMHGIELCRRLKASYDFRVIGSSSDPMIGGLPAEEVWKQAGADGFYLKEEHADVIISMIKQYAR